VESCVIFNELAGNEDSDLFNSLLLYSDDSLACFTSPESIDNKFESKRFYVFLFNTHIEDPVVSLFETYDNGTLTGVQTFYLVPSLDYSFEVSETGDGDNGIRPLHGELSKDTFSWAQLVTQRSFDNWHYYSLDVSLATGRMTRVWGGKPTFGRCFWFDHQSIDAAKELSRPQWATKEAAEAIARDRSETAVKLKAQIAAGTDATKKKNKRANDCVQNYYKQRCGSCSDEQAQKIMFDAWVARGSTFVDVAEKCERQAQ
jgi:hypothetical protein